MTNKLTRRGEEPGWMKSIGRFRDDIAMANPVAFLVQVMNGQEVEGERLSLRDRVEVAKYLASRVVPMVAPEERGLGGGQVVQPPPLTIVMHGVRREEMRDVTVDTAAVVVEDGGKREG